MVLIEQVCSLPQEGLHLLGPCPRLKVLLTFLNRVVLARLRNGDRLNSNPKEIRDAAERRARVRGAGSGPADVWELGLWEANAELRSRLAVALANAPTLREEARRATRRHEVGRTGRACSEAGVPRCA